MDSITPRTCTPEEALGSLNEVERRNAPPALYLAGRIELLRRRPRLSVIGSRDASPDALILARSISEFMVARGAVVVSGLARGVDTVAHQRTAELGGDTIAVLGTPLSRAYPRENAGLQRRLMEQHLVVSQFPEGATTRPSSFVERNRTMALLSNGSVIVEAGENSGTAHQGWEALRLGRTLFLPEGLVARGYDWPRKLVAYGAIVFASMTELRDLLDEYLPSVPGDLEASEVGF